MYLFEQNRYASILITFLDALFILHEIYLFLQRELIYKYLYLALLRDNILQRELIYMYLYLALLHHNIFPKEKIYISNIYKDISLRKWDLQNKDQTASGHVFIRSRFLVRDYDQNSITRPSIPYRDKMISTFNASSQATAETYAPLP